MKLDGYYTTKQLYELGYTKEKIRKMVGEGTIERVKRGVYMTSNLLDDEFKIIQMNNPNLIFSNETSLFMHDLIDRVPHVFSVTTYSGANVNMKKGNLKVYYVKRDLLFLGAEEITDNMGNKIIVYDLERSICDAVKNKNRIDPQYYVQAMQNYFLYGHPNVSKLAEYAKKLNVYKKIIELYQIFQQP